MELASFLEYLPTVQKQF